jgi:hypothetical protein
MKPARIVAILSAALLVFYPLSVGPVLRAYYSPVAKGYVGMPPALQDFYMPLGWMCDYCRPVEKFFSFYIRLWIPEMRPGTASRGTRAYFAIFQRCDSVRT